MVQVEVEKQMQNKVEVKDDLFKLLNTLKENNVTFTSGHEIELNEDGKWINKRRIF